MHKNKIVFNILALCVSLMLTGCVVAPPDHPDDICKIFKQYPKWYWAAQDTQKKWGVSIPVQMAILHQESHFQSKAKPPRKKLLGFIPWCRPTSAYGYTQALDMTWERYQQQSGRISASRKQFKDALDFVGWYANLAHKRAGISKNNAYSLYLAYHEGIGGYQRRTYLKKKWLIQVAHKVSRRSHIYAAQLKRCQRGLPKRHWWNLFS